MTQTSGNPRGDFLQDNDIMRILRDMLNYLDEGIHIIDSVGNTIIYNHVMQNIEGLSPNEVIGRNIFEVFPSLSANTSTLYQALTTGKVITEQLQTYTNLHGKTIHAINISIPIVYQSKIIGALEISRDISVINNLQNKIISLQQALINTKSKEHTGAYFTFADILGDSAALKTTIEKARRAARTNSAILIQGESGTGKELFAQGIHNASPRSHKPFIAFNCAALPASLLEGILFGTRKGSFTGAIDRPGLFEQADEGTILLDEINSLPVELQAKLLRILQEQKVRRLGSMVEKKINVRIISTVNTDLQQLLSSGQLRQDLFYRIGVVILNIPPLRERQDDIFTLSKHYIKTYNQLFGTAVTGLSPAVHDLFLSYHWPGNVRELMHVIEGALNMIATEDVISLEHLPPYIFYHIENQTDQAVTNAAGEPPAAELPPVAAANKLPLVVGQLEETLIKNALAKNHGNLTRASVDLGIKRQLLQYKLKKYHIDPHQLSSP